MSLITLKSRFDNQDEAYLFKCDFPQPIVIKPNSEIELLNFECRRADGFVINENNNRFRIKLGGKTDKGYKQRLVVIPSGNYSGDQLAAEVARQMNLITVNSAYRQSAASIAVGNASGWSGKFFSTGGDDNGPYFELKNNQNLLSEFNGNVSDEKGDWVYADINEGTTLPTTTYMDQVVNQVATTFDAGTNLTGKWTVFEPKSSGTITNPDLIHRKIMANHGLYENGQLSYLIPKHEGKGIQTGGVISNLSAGNDGYVVGDTGSFITDTGTGQGATYEITAISGSGTITTFDIINHGSGYNIGDILKFQATSSGQATYTLAGSVLPSGAGGFYKCKVGFARYLNFEGADWLDEPNGEWGVEFGDYMVEINPSDDNDGQPQIRISYTQYSTAIAPPQVNWREQKPATNRGWKDLNLLLPTYALGDNLKIDFVRVSGAINIFINHDASGNYIFDAANQVKAATTSAALGADGHLSKSIDEGSFPYIPFVYTSAGVANNNKIAVSGVFSNINKATIIEAQEFHNTTGRFDQNPTVAVSYKTLAEESMWDGDNTHTEQEQAIDATSPGDALKLSLMLRMREIELVDLTPSGSFPRELYEYTGTTFPNDANIWLTLGEPAGFLIVPNTDMDDPFDHKLTRPTQEVDEAAYHIEIQELPVISYNGFSTDIGKDIMVIPREQLQTGQIAGALTWNSQYKIPVDLHNIDVMYLNSMTVYIRDSDGKFSTGLEKPTQLTFKITEKEDFSKSMRGAMREIASSLGKIQGNSIDNIGQNNPLL